MAPDGRSAYDQVGTDANLGERPEHTDLMRAEQPALAEHERGRHAESPVRDA